jgi:hypothetical protein
MHPHPNPLPEGEGTASGMAAFHNLLKPIEKHPLSPWERARVRVRRHPRTKRLSTSQNSAVAVKVGR